MNEPTEEPQGSYSKRIYYRVTKFGDDFDCLVGIRSPESMLTDRLRFTPPKLTELSAEKLAALMAHMVCIGLGFGFKHGLLVGTVGDIEKVHPGQASMVEFATQTPRMTFEQWYARKEIEDREDAEYYGTPNVFVGWESVNLAPFKLDTPATPENLPPQHVPV